MIGAIVLSAWCLGVLNSHRRFLLPYLAPCFWNASVIAAVLVVARGTAGDGADRVEALAMAVCWGGLAGGLLQFAVQLPLVLRVTEGLRPSLTLRAPGVRTTLANLGPAVAARGVGQLGAWVDLFLASFLVEGAFAALTWGQRLYLLPIALFAVSVAAAELPELSRLRSEGEERARAAAERARRSLAAMSFLVAPTTVGYLLLGFGIVGAIYRRGAFRAGRQRPRVPGARRLLPRSPGVQRVAAAAERVLLVGGHPQPGARRVDGVSSLRPAPAPR